MKRFTGFFLSCILLLTCTLTVYADEPMSYSSKDEAYALDSFSGEQLGAVSDLNITQTDISFDYSGNSFSWTINKSDGAFVAEATVSALVKGFPLMWTLYDVSYMNGAH